MSRPIRIEFPNALYHVTSRGVRREDIFDDDDDRRAFLKTLGDVVGQFNWLCYAWCLMDNHYHLLIQTPDGNLSKGMRQLNGVYTQLSNRRHRRVGHLFQGRFKAILVDSDGHLLELARYVVLNPVRARMVKRATDWEWSSYRASLGIAPAPCETRYGAKGRNTGTPKGPCNVLHAPVMAELHFLSGIPAIQIRRVRFLIPRSGDDEITLADCIIHHLLGRQDRDVPLAVLDRGFDAELRLHQLG